MLVVAHTRVAGCMHVAIRTYVCIDGTFTVICRHQFSSSHAQTSFRGGLGGSVGGCRGHGYLYGMDGWLSRMLSSLQRRCNLTLTPRTGCQIHIASLRVNS